jgi:hypothetical protein
MHLTLIFARARRHNCNAKMSIKPKDLGWGSLTDQQMTKADKLQLLEERKEEVFSRLFFIFVSVTLSDARRKNKLHTAPRERARG